MKTFAYIRVSTDDQTVENQRNMINERGYHIDEWLCDEGVSGTKDWHKRDIHEAVTNAQPGDRIIVAELSRIGRSLKQVLEIVEICRDKNVELVMIRENLVLSDDNPTTKLLISVLGSLAEMERNLIAERTKDALALRRKQGVVLGRPKGKKNSAKHSKLYGKEAAIKSLRRRGYSKTKSAKILGVDRNTLSKYVLDHGDKSLQRVFEREGRQSDVAPGYEHKREVRNRNRQQVINNPNDARHGTVTGWNYGCRCNKCSEWRSGYIRELKIKRKLEEYEKELRSMS